ncbi:ADP-ribosyltransferase [Actinomadura sp. NPDC048394]|uniref:ADP-ribosyltransferase n=1 Tax=Actinomadura sp. NPDC048394 TaxID=3158223 RepID=UPI003402AA47
MADGRSAPPDPEQYLRFEGADGEAYGEQYYAHAFKALAENAPDQHAAIYDYTRGGVLNTALRAMDEGRDLGGFLNSLHRDRMLAEHLTGLSLRLQRNIAASDLPQILRTIDLTSGERNAIEDVLNSPAPGRLKEIYGNAGTHESLERYLREMPTRELLEKQIELIDQGLSTFSLPDSIQLKRSVGSLGHLRLSDGTPLGEGDPKLLENTSQTEAGYTSASLGETLFSPNNILTLDVPAGTKGIWVGRSSAKPLEREFVLQRRLRYKIVSVERVGTDVFGRGQYHVHARVLRPDEVMAPEIGRLCSTVPSHVTDSPPDIVVGRGAAERSAAATPPAPASEPPHAAASVPHGEEPSHSGIPKPSGAQRPSSVDRPGQAVPGSEAPVTGRLPDQGRPIQRIEDSVGQGPAGDPAEPGAAHPHHDGAPPQTKAAGEQAGHRPPMPEPDSVTSIADRLRRGIESGIDERRTVPLFRGGVAERVDLVTFNDGSKAVRKVTWGEDLDTADADELSALVGHAVEARVPAVHRADAHTLYMEHVDGQGVWDMHPHAHPDDLRALYGDKPGARNLGLMDALTANGDREWLVDRQGRVWGIDHGATFWLEPDSAAVQAGNPFSRHFVEGTRIGPRGEEYIWRPNALNPADVEAIEQRLNALRPRFEARDRSDWFEGMMKRWEFIKANARGTTPILDHDAPRFGTRPENSGPPATPHEGGPLGAAAPSRPRGVHATGSPGSTVPSHVNESGAEPLPDGLTERGEVERPAAETPRVPAPEPAHAVAHVPHGDEPPRSGNAKPPEVQRPASDPSPETRMRDQYGESLSETTSDVVHPERVDPRLHYGWYEDDRSAAGTRGEASSGGSEASPGHPAASEARPGSEVLGDAPQEGGPLPGGELETADPTKPRPLHQDEVEPGEAAAPSGDQVAPWSPGEEVGAPAADRPPETQPPASGRTPEPRTAEWPGQR